MVCSLKLGFLCASYGCNRVLKMRMWLVQVWLDELRVQHDCSCLRRVSERSDVEVMPYGDMGQCGSEWKCSVAGFFIGTSSVVLEWGQRANWEGGSGTMAMGIN